MNGVVLRDNEGRSKWLNERVLERRRKEREGGKEIWTRERFQVERN